MSPTLVDFCSFQHAPLPCCAEAADILFEIECLAPRDPTWNSGDFPAHGAEKTPSGNNLPSGKLT